MFVSVCFVSSIIELAVILTDSTMPRKKPFKYEIADIVSEYNEELYNDVKDKITIKLVKGFQGWSAKIKNNEAIITYNKSNYADACFAHELLHIKYELNGLQPPLIKDNENVKNIMPFLFNQLCHHKFYQEFYDMGFNEEEFLNENDASEVDTIAKRDIRLLEGIFNTNGIIKGSTALLLPYIVLKSPHDNSETTKQHIERLKKIGDNNFFQTIDTILQDWANQKSLDSSMTFARIFKACNCPRVGFCLSGKDEDVIVAGNGRISLRGVSTA